MDEMILLVDDDPNILNGYRRTLRKHFRLKTALGSQQGIKTFREEGPFAVVISDMKMPEMDGIEFLQRVQDHDPETVRIMLTGYAEFNTVIEAINKGHIFRFITKPCSAEDMTRVIQDGIKQYRLIRSEKDLLDNTLKKSVKVLTDILSMINPGAFGRASRIRRYVMQLAELLKFRDPWILEITAMLSQIGFVAMPAEILDKVYLMEELSERELKLYNEYPKIGADLIKDIPKLGVVSEIVRKQLWDYQDFKDTQGLSYDEKIIALGAQILRVVMSFDERISRGLAVDTTIALMKKKPQQFNTRLVDLLAQIKTARDFSVVKKLTVEELTPEMTTLEEVRSASGLLLVPKYQDLTELIIERLTHHKRESGVKEPIAIAYTNY